MNALNLLKACCEYLGGSRDAPPFAMAATEEAKREAGVWDKLMKFAHSPLGRGLWWGLMAGLILLFSGQSSKFIYIDF